MLEIKRHVLSLEPQEVMELERIVTDLDREEALIFLKRVVYSRLHTSQENRLKSHLDGKADPVEGFKSGGK
jgi:hypothetical protein